MRIPKSWNEITVEQFQECYFILGKSPSIDNWVLVLSVLTGKSVSKIEELPIRDLRSYIKKLDFLMEPKINEKVNKMLYIRGRVFKAVTDASLMQTNQIVDIKGFMSGDKPVNDLVVENLHRLLACIYLPLTFRGYKYVPGSHRKISEYFKKVKVGEVYGTLFFYSNLYNELTKATQDFGEKNLQIVKDHLKELEEWQRTSTKDGVGMAQSAS